MRYEKKRNRMEIPLARPDITEREIEAVVNVLRSPYLSLGPKLEEFEQRLAEYVGVKYAVVVNSGTSALHLIIKALKIGDNDEVITTPFSFVASANCILFERATPVFVDIDPLTLNIDPHLIDAQITDRTKAILAVDVFGHPAEWGRLREIAGEYDLRLIEDAAEALGAEYKGEKAGSLADGAIFGFYPNKQITTGEGGAVLSDDKEMIELCRSMRNQGRSNEDGWLEHSRLGYNYRLSDINCALGIVQLERVDELLGKRARVAQFYNERLQEVEGIEIPYTSPDVRRGWFVYVIKLNDVFTKEARNKIINELREKGIECSNYFGPLHLQQFYRDKFGYSEGNFPVTERIAERTIALPFYGNITEKAIDYVCDNLRRLVKSGR
jgi:perosamine synthetase